MKKFLSVFLTLLLVFAILTSCEKKPSNQGSATDVVTDQIINQTENNSGNLPSAPVEDESDDESDDEAESTDKEEDLCDHEGGEDATCVTESICEICNKPYGGVDTGNHEGDEEWDANAESHILIYGCCGAEIEDAQPHTFSNGICSVCKYECEHTEEDSHSCSLCGAFIKHNYVNGKCADCGLTLNGENVTFGIYPQAKVTSSALISTLNSKSGEWTLSNGMWYLDVENETDKYRGVKTSQGGVAVWFKYQPISWTILEESNGKALVLCDMIIDAMAYDSSSNSYEDSDVRAWLNESFLSTAFDALQREVILTTLVKNDKDSTGYGENARFYGNNTNDKIFLLSRIEAKSYGFNSDGSVQDSARKKQATAYAIAQINGGYDATNGAWWWLRTPAHHTTDASRADLAHNIKVNGSLNNTNVSTATGGILPAIWINL